jgi:tRNA(fMet)-specific endonuclease VapC
MKAFDADVLTLIFHGNAAYAQKLAQIPAADRTIPIVAAEQMLRGRLNYIRQTEAGKTKSTLDNAYSFLEKTIHDFQGAKLLPYTAAAEALVQSWRKQKIKVGISDLRIAAICVAHSATLISRNRRDFDQVPGLLIEYHHHGQTRETRRVPQGVSSHHADGARRGGLHRIWANGRCR